MRDFISEINFRKDQKQYKNYTLKTFCSRDMSDQQNPGQQFNDQTQKSNEIITYLYNLLELQLQIWPTKYSDRNKIFFLKTMW